MFSLASSFDDTLAKERATMHIKLLGWLVTDYEKYL